MSATILELRARVEALEAAQLEQAESHRFCTDAIVRRVEALEAPMTELRAASAEAQPGGSLLERVANAMGPQSQAAMDAGELPHGAARAAIREVAKWLRAGRMLHAAELLEQETDRG
jgi:hypothetical protein